MVKVVVILYILYSLILPAGAQEFRYRLDPSAEPESAWETMRDGLPPPIRQELENVDLNDPAKAVQTVREKADLRFWLMKLRDAFSASAGDLLPTMTGLLSLILIGAAAELILPTFSPGLGAAFARLAGLITAITVFSTTEGILNAAQTHLGILCSFMNLMTPVMEAAYLSEGQPAQSTLSSAALMLAVTVMADLNAYLLAPVIRGLFTLSAISLTCPDTRIGGAVSSMRKLATRLWSLTTLFFSFFLGTQTVLARSADDLAAKTAKFALGSFVPVAGGMLAEAFSALREGMRVLRLTAGIGGILALLLLLLPGIVPLICYRMMLSLTGTAAELLGQNGVSAMLGEMKGVTELLTAVVLCTGTLFLFAVLLFARSS